MWVIVGDKAFYLDASNTVWRVTPHGDPDDPFRVTLVRRFGLDEELARDYLNGLRLAVAVRHILDMAE